jgi:hypothetical protein
LHAYCALTITPFSSPNLFSENTHHQLLVAAIFQMLEELTRWSTFEADKTTRMAHFQKLLEGISDLSILVLSARDVNVKDLVEEDFTFCIPKLLLEKLLTKMQSQNPFAFASQHGKLILEDSCL